MAISLNYSRVGNLTEEDKPQLTLTVTQADTIPEEIFVYKVDDRGASADKYVAISSAKELDTLPSSRLGVSPGNYYRRSSAIIVFDTADTMSLGLNTIKASIESLFLTYKKLIEVLQINDTVELT